MNFVRLLCLLLSVGLARAHKIDSMEFDFQETEDAWAFEGVIDLTYMLPEFRNDPDAVALSRTQMMETPSGDWGILQKKITATARQLLVFEFAGKEVPYDVLYPDFDVSPFELPEEPMDVALITVRLAMTPVEGEGVLKVYWLDDQEAELIITLKIDEDTEILSTIPGGDLDLMKQDADGAISAPDESTFWSWLASGFRHVIPKGWDHVLFILGIFLLLPKLKPLLGQSLLFTLAHSITLSCTVLGVINLPSTYVEILIAASIAWVGLENLWLKKLSKQRIAFIFGFGLLHGLGFASVLGEKLENIAKSDQVLPLIGFNIGVEVAQVAILLGAWLLLRACKESWHRKIQITGSLLIAFAGIFWMIERITELS